jgi:hypothetical protein
VKVNKKSKWPASGQCEGLKEEEKGGREGRAKKLSERFYMTRKSVADLAEETKSDQ